MDDDDILQFNNNMYDAYVLFQRDVTRALLDKQLITDDIERYNKDKDLLGDSLYKIIIQYLEKRLKEVENRIKGLQSLQKAYNRKLIKLHKNKMEEMR